MPITEALLNSLDPRWKRWLEVGVRHPVRGWIDVVLADIGASLAIATEIESSPRRLEQVIRWSRAKAEALPSSPSWPLGLASPSPTIDRLLVLRDTRANRELFDEFETSVRTAYPGDPWQALASLRGDAPWPGASMVWAAERGTVGGIDLTAARRRPRSGGSTSSARI
jgi:hypothetical protein